MDVITTFSSRHLFGLGGNGWSFLKQGIFLVVGLRIGDAVHCVSFLLPIRRWNIAIAEQALFG